MDKLEFVETNKGPMALRRHGSFAARQYTQVWQRTNSGDWKETQYYTKDRSSELSSGLLEALYQGCRNKGIRYEDFW